MVYYALACRRHVRCQGSNNSNVIVSYVKDIHYATALRGVVLSIKYGIIICTKTKETINLSQFSLWQLSKYSQVTFTVIYNFFV